MTGRQSKTIAMIRRRYLRDYRLLHGEQERSMFFEEIGAIARAAGALAWESFADGMSAAVRKEMAVALGRFEDAISLDPDFAYPWHSKGNVLADQNRYDEALAAYEKAISLDPEFANPWNGKGNVLRRQKRYDEALAALEKAILLDPDLVYPWNGKGNVLADLKRYDEALAAYEKAISLDPGEATPHYNVGLLHWQDGRPHEAAAAFRRAIASGLEPAWKEVAKRWIEHAERMINSQKAGDGDMLLVLQAWNSFSPLLHRGLCARDGLGPDERATCGTAAESRLAGQTTRRRRRGPPG